MVNLKTIFYKWRELLLSPLFRDMGSPVWIYPQAHFYCPENISIGERCTFEDFAVLRTNADGKGISIGDDVHLWPSVMLDAGNGAIRIGDRTLIQHGSTILGEGTVRIGKNVLIGPGVVITSFQHGFDDLTIPIVKQKPWLNPVTIEDNVYIASNVVICPGVTIKSGAVIGAGSVVTRDVPPNTIAFGVPARLERGRG